MLRHLFSSPFLNFSSVFRLRSVPHFARFPSSFPNPDSFSSMSGRTVADVLMAAARASASRKGQPPLKKAKVAEDAAKKEPEASDEQPKPISGAGGDKKVDVDVKIRELKKSPASFDPKLAAFWKEGEHVPFLFLARAFDLISNESGRIAMTDILCNVFRTVIVTAPKDLVAVVYLSANKIAPAHEGIELGIKEAAIIKVLAEACGSNEEHIKTQMKELGDLGLVAKSGRRTQALLKKPVPLTVVNVLKTFRDIAEESGNKSQDKKRVRFKNLLVAASDCEPLYLVRLLQSKMRIGLAEQTVLVALGHAAVYSEIPPVPSSQLQTRLEEASRAVKQVYSVLPIYDRIVSALLDVGVRNLTEACMFSLGVPVGPMLAKPTRGVAEVLDKFQGTEFTCEYKYDGERAQIHYMENGKIEIYSRNAERNTEKFPDVVDSVTSFKKPSVQSFVLDCEVVAYDREHQKILPFQVLSTRARKDVLLNDIKVQVCVFAFDILYLNGQALLQEQLRTRRELLYNSFGEVDGVFRFATATISNELDEIQTFLDAAVNNSCEGLIIKTLDKDATYEPSKRSMNWLKLKKDYMDSIGDSLDLVPVAAFHGRGKRTGVYGAFLLACYDEVNEEYQTICKIGTGFSEAVLEERSASLRDKVIATPKPYYRYGDTMKPDVWFEPSQVWEVKAADLSISPVHCAAIGEVDSNKGISLRFPRLLKIREDKNPDQATTSSQVAEMYRNQKINHARNEEDED